MNVKRVMHVAIIKSASILMALISAYVNPVISLILIRTVLAIMDIVKVKEKL